MTHCWYQLNVDTTNAINTSWKFLPHERPLGVWYLREQDVFTKEWMDYTSSLGLKIHSAMAFYRAPFSTAPTAHIDLYKENDTVNINSFGMNMVFGGIDSEMIWYNKPEFSISDAKYTEADTPFIDFPVKTLTEIDRGSLKNKLTLVRTDVPHTIKMGVYHRWCISARVDIPNVVSWNEIVNELRSKKLLIERN